MCGTDKLLHDDVRMHALLTDNTIQERCQLTSSSHSTAPATERARREVDKAVCDLIPTSPTIPAMIQVCCHINSECLYAVIELHGPACL